MSAGRDSGPGGPGPGRGGGSRPPGTTLGSLDTAPVLAQAGCPAPRGRGGQPRAARVAGPLPLTDGPTADVRARGTDRGAGRARAAPQDPSHRGPTRAP